jgi:sRNA-binding protein
VQPASGLPTATATDADDTRNAQREALRSVLAIWIERLPGAFTFPPRPLKRGIHVEIIAAEPDMPANMVSAAMRFWVSSQDYQRALMCPGAMRFGLTGEPIEAVSPQHQADAAAWLCVRKKRRRRCARSPELRGEASHNEEPEGGAPSAIVRSKLR